LKKIAVLFAFLTGIIMGVGGLWMSIQNNTELRYYLFEQLSPHPDQSQVSAFVQSIVRGDQETAYKLWEVSDGIDAEQQIALMNRRDDVIANLLLAKIEPEYLLREIEWWTICCEPGVINESRYAGGA
jgi:hypothetical protein